MAKHDQNQSHKRRRTCATMDEHRRLTYLYPEYRRRRREIELETREFVARYAEEGLRTGVVRIPVVVHVVWNTVAQNVSVAQIQSQIDAMNADFRRTNADAGSVPTAFAGVAADTRIEFALAVRDPNCGATNGITRTHTATTGFVTATRNDVKSAATGGADPWPSDRYLNMWVANFTDSLLGFATFPGGPAALDGYVVRTDAFGTVGTAAAPFNLGRTATHEIGHWLNLIHIWGDDGASPAGNCSGSDECGDTPNQGIENYFTPAFPHVSCSNGPNGDMFMNYMDYVDDAAMFMFTQDQATRMNATLSVARASILASDGLIPVSAAPTPDLWMQDNADDTGAEPDASPNPMYISDDIWVRNNPDGLANQDHQNPLGEQLNRVYVRVRNRGCAAAGSQTGTLKLYWAKASSSLSWPAPWDGSVISPALMGGLIGSQPVLVAGGAQQIVEFDWTPPDPSDYAVFGADKAHFCLLARIETSPTAPFGMTTSETGNLYANVQNNNNIVWKNISIVDTDGDGARFADVVIGNFGDERRKMHLAFETPRRRGAATLFDWGHILVEFRGKALAKWAKGSVKGKGVEPLSDGRLIIIQSGAQITGPALKPDEFGTLHVQFVPNGRRATGAQVFELDVTELDAKARRTGGQRFLLKTTSGRMRPCWDKQFGTFDGVTWMPKRHCGCGCNNC
jgi:Pregnancy-associated plasma protein-A